MSSSEVFPEDDSPYQPNMQEKHRLPQREKVTTRHCSYTMWSDKSPGKHGWWVNSGPLLHQTRLSELITGYFHQGGLVVLSTIRARIPNQRTKPEKANI